MNVARKPLGSIGRLEKEKKRSEKEGRSQAEELLGEFSLDDRSMDINWKERASYLRSKTKHHQKVSQKERACPNR